MRRCSPSRRPRATPAMRRASRPRKSGGAATERRQAFFFFALFLLVCADFVGAGCALARSAFGFFGARFFHAIVSAFLSVAASAAASLTCVEPWRPQPPGTG